MKWVNYHDMAQLLLIIIIVNSKNCTIIIINKENMAKLVNCPMLWLIQDPLYYVYLLDALAKNQRGCQSKKNGAEKQKEISSDHFVN